MGGNSCSQQKKVDPTAYLPSVRPDNGMSDRVACSRATYARADSMHPERVAAKVLLNLQVTCERCITVDGGLWLREQHHHILLHIQASTSTFCRRRGCGSSSRPPAGEHPANNRVNTDCRYIRQRLRERINDSYVVRVSSPVVLR